MADRPRDPRIKLTLSESETANVAKLVEAFQARAQKAGLPITIDASGMVHGWISQRIAAELENLKKR